MSKMKSRLDTWYPFLVSVFLFLLSHIVIIQIDHRVKELVAQTTANTSIVIIGFTLTNLAIILSTNSRRMTEIRRIPILLESITGYLKKTAWYSLALFVVSVILILIMGSKFIYFCHTDVVNHVFSVCIFFVAMSLCWFFKTLGVLFALMTPDPPAKDKGEL